MSSRPVLALVAVAAVAGPAGADGGVPAPVRVEISLAGRTAHVVARFQVEVSGPDTTAGLALPLPRHAVVTAATATLDGTSHALALVPANDGDAAMSRVVLGAGGPDRAWALLLQGGGSTGEAVLDVAAPRDGELAVELVLEAPTCFADDTRYVELPAGWDGALDVALALRVRHDSGELVRLCQGQAGAVWVPFAAPLEHARIAARAGALALPGARITRVELDLAHHLGEIPRDLHTVVLVDGSRSLTAQEAGAQRAILEAYLRAVARTDVQILAYTRIARPLLAGWTPALRVTSRVAEALRALVPRNGSDVGAALAAAGAWLARVRGTRRVLLFSDERLADRLSRLDPRELARTLPAGTLVQVVALDGGTGLLARDDDAMLAPLAAATEGIAVRGRVEASGNVDATVLARPISLDEVTVHGDGWQPVATETSCDGSDVHEGTSCTWWARAGSPAGAVTVHGLAWNHRVTRVLAPDPAEGLVIARELAAASLLDAGDQAQVDLAARAVDPAWSMFATWGGPAGYADLGGKGYGSFGPGGYGSSTDCGGYDDPVAVPRLDLRAQLAPAVEACSPARATVTLTVETTREEIVDVHARVRGAASPAAARVLADCATEAAWRTNLVLPSAPGHATTTVVVGGDPR